MQSLSAIGRFAIFSGRVAARLVRGPWFLRGTFEHCWTVVLRCTLPVIAVVFPFGMVMSLQGLAIFELFGAHRMLASLISVAVLRELSPVLASVLVAAQGGSSFAAELGSMRIKEELDATEVMGVDGVAYHVVPRVLALTLACPILNLIGSVAGLAGGFLTAVVFKGEQAGIFMSELWAFTGPIDLWGGLLKTTIFGAVIGLVACYQGYNATGGAAGVGRAVNDTVVYSVLVFLTANYVLTSALFGSLG
ncbi:MAG: ABC transporter permease [Proteobacteria bacterium]|nr:ABC transporter permease [Pseudomonadota bacterium]MCP4918785.1 ABC transporter permease [Pseudomonadota bacterium]